MLHKFLKRFFKVIRVKNAAEIELMRKSCQLAAKVLVMIEPYVKPGVSTEELNKICHDFIVKNGALPSPLNYEGFPKSICSSVNEVICHGIPAPKQILKDGDIVNLDITTTLEGYFGDTSKTFFVGTPKPNAKKLVEITKRCLEIGIEQVKPNARVGDIGAAIQAYAESFGYSVVRDFTGHGIGKEFHEEPPIPHHGKAGTGPRLREGMIFTIEPMINEGTYKSKILKDGWTAVTQDGKLSAQFEHTVLVTENGCEVLTNLKT
ncbi:type I methionyl aminopeptidase [bacterium]|nr:type I methionyl aminopeptidase [bacterium]